ncbi:MAG: DNA-directed RNA polymerase subunit omega [Candidatus Poribacteria bacterium]|nr:DNA-directed RNA polymerase subunit omega [Candidatus Poribacteria bacterium]
MAIVYLEELVKHVPNKYLAVNVIAKRARSLNDELLGAGLSKKQKPVSIATDELSSGELSYKIVDTETAESGENSQFTSESEGYDSVEGEDHLAELYGEKSTEDSEKEVEENAEEGEVVSEDDTA